MDHQAFAQLLGNYGEFVGAIAVVATLFYLAIQVRHSKEATEANTRSIDENLKVAMAQIFQARAAETAVHFRVLAESEYVPLSLEPIESGIDSLSAEEVARLRFREMSNIQRMDSTYYAHQLGLLDEEYYQSNFIPAIQRMAPFWKKLGLPPMRASFVAEVDHILTLEPRPGSSGFGPIS